MTIEQKIGASDKKRDYGTNILCIGIGLAGMYVFGSSVIYKTLEIENEINTSGLPVSEFYQANRGVFLKADINALFFGLNVINTYIGIFHKFYENNAGEKNE